MCSLALVAGTAEALQLRRVRLFPSTTLALVSSQAPLAWGLAECPRVFQSTVRWAVRATASPRDAARRGVFVVLGSRTAALREAAVLRLHWVLREAWLFLGTTLALPSAGTVCGRVTRNTLEYSRVLRARLGVARLPRGGLPYEDEDEEKEEEGETNPQRFEALEGAPRGGGGGGGREEEGETTPQRLEAPPAFESAAGAPRGDHRRRRGKTRGRRGGEDEPSRAS